MIRTQLSIDKREYTRLKKAAKAQGISVAEFVRRAVRSALPDQGERPWMRFVGMIESGDPNSSQTVDEVVYGHKP